MWKIFEQPWTLLVTAAIALFVIFQIRSFLPEKRRWWQWLIPLAIALAGLACDYFVKTELEQIRAVLKTGMKAAEAEDCHGIAAIISPTYTDSYHFSKQQLMVHCRAILVPSLINKVKKRNLLVEISDRQAAAVLTVLVIFDEASYVSRQYKSFALIQMRLDFEKLTGQGWLISRAEILEIDRQPLDWRDVRRAQSYGM
jgi:hypothetical protein